VPDAPHAQHTTVCLVRLFFQATGAGTTACSSVPLRLRPASCALSAIRCAEMSCKRVCIASGGRWPARIWARTHSVAMASTEDMLGAPCDKTLRGLLRESVE
jgi:hypothetical protein